MVLPARVQIWKPLDPSKRQIRLLALDPSPSIEQHPSGRLLVRSLDSHPIYDAISHAWGGPQASLPLYIDGFRVPLTESLQSCLRHLRHATKPRLFWVDAVCVNQFDIVERGQQVQQMQHIFRNAVTVRAWLGDFQSSRMSKVFFIIKELSSGVRFENIIWDQKHLTTRDAEDLALFTKSSWWSRLWVRQEVALARNLDIHYGRHSVPLATISNFLDSFFKSSEYERILKDEDELRASFESFGAIVDLKNTNQLLSTAANGADPKQVARKMVDFMCLSRLAQVQDVRDRVYGLSGIFSALFDDTMVKVDYTITPQEVFTRFAFDFIRITRTLLILNQTKCDENSMADLPSWVADWSSLSDFLHEGFLLNTRGRSFRSSGHGLMPAPMIDETMGHLGLKCYVFGRIEKVGSICDSQGGITFSRFRESARDCLDSWNSEPWAQVRSAIFARTMMRDSYTRWTESGWDVGRLVNDNEAENTYRKGRGGADLTLWRSISKTRLFKSAEGKLGLGPPDTQQGDVLAVMLGGDVPYVLRKSTNREKGNLYRFVGECYVHGIMDGELVEAEDFPGFEDIWLE